MAVRQLACDDHRARRHVRAFDVLPADAQEIVVRHAVVEVQAALVAAFGQRRRRQRGGRTRRPDHDRIRLGADQLQRLADDARILRGEPLVRDERDLACRSGLLDLHEERFAERIGEADVSDRLHARRGRVLEDRAGHHDVGLRRLERPRALRVDRLDDAHRRRQRDHGRLGVREHVEHCKRIGRRRRAGRSRSAHGRSRRRRPT